MTIRRTLLLAVLGLMLIACKGDKGDKGDRGDVGPQGQPGATGATGPVGPTGPLPDVSYAGRFLEAEGPTLSSTVTTGTAAADATASRGQARFGAGSGTAGRLWAVGSGDVGGLLGTGRTQVAVRAKVTSNLSTAVLAQLTCLATRAGDTTPTAVSATFEIRPNEFSSGTWRELAIRCEFLPNDVDQLIAVDGFVAGVTDLSLDYVRITPLASGTRLLGLSTCATCGNSTESFTGTTTVKGATTGQLIRTTVFVGQGPVLATMTSSWAMTPAMAPWCGIRVLDDSGAQVAFAWVNGTNAAMAGWACSGSFVFTGLTPGKYTFEAVGWVSGATSVSWREDRQITVWEL